ncbi:hypothetical protein BLA60_40315 [Actinophytocola xinjiangensis]|uniref:Aminopeptidase N n=1 Tax=Actinophytocola xinjiangensis TaxID=485602 RepID=A0A7Z0WCZ1_9PSEU|nr:hypothetical protein BLA60_40315 [Actinophytocola xinjiangensis]
MAVAVGLTTAPATALATGDDTIGAPGVGDPYYPLDGNGGFDVAHYDLRLNYQPDTDELWGTTTIRATTTQRLSRFNLDFLLTPSSVRVNGAPAGFVSSDDGELVVTPARTLGAGRPMTVTVTYRDHPDRYQRYGEDPWRPDGDAILIARQPHMAPWWYPSNDHPSDKATYDIAMTVPDGLEVVSTGLPVATTPRPDGRTRWHWRSTHPQGTYQTGLVIDDFDVETSTTPSGLPVINAYATDAANQETARAVLGRTPEFIAFLESRFGPYPFESTGAVLATQNAALEVQTRPFINQIVFGEDSLLDPVVVMVHEYAHMWFGNSVSMRDWRDFWLSEGFATYAEWLWLEDTGESTAQAQAKRRYDQYPADHAIWQVPVAEPGRFDGPSIGAVYYRGGMVLHALRVEVGDDTFLTILRDWARSRAGGYGDTAEFTAHAERIAGRDLSAVWDAWLYSTGKPPAPPAGPAGT